MARTATGRAGWLPAVAAVAGGGFLLAGGAWAMVDPESFFERAAEFPPYNQHFV